jgi:HlyD family secretion protein
MRFRIMGPCLAAAMGLLIACGEAGKTDVADMKVTKEDFRIVIPAFGELQAVKSTPLVIPPTSYFGRQTISWIAPESSNVKAGDPVIRMDSLELREFLRTEEAEVAKLDLEVAKKEKQLEKEKSDLYGQIAVTSIEKKLADVFAARDETIFPRNKIIEDAIDLQYQGVKEEHYGWKKGQLEKKTAAELVLLQSKVRACRVKIGQYQAQLQNLEIRAPHDGILLIEKLWSGEKFRVGMNVWGGQKLGSLPDLSRMEAKVYVLESDAGGLRENLGASVSLDFEPGKVFPGKVIGIDTIAKPIEENSPLKYFETKVSLDVTDAALMKPGVQVKASLFVQQQAGVLAVPNQALVFEQGKAFVMVKKSSRIQKRSVDIGPRSLTRTIITRGLNEGEVILLGNPKPIGGK